MKIRDWRGQFGDARWWAQAFAFALVAGAGLGVLGPFGSFLNGDVSLRVFSWTGNLLAGTVILGLIVPFVTQVALRLGLPRLFGVAAGVLVATAPAAGFSYAFGHWLWPREIDRVRPIDWFTQALIIEIAMIALWSLIMLAREAMRPAPADAPEVSTPDLSAPVLCLHMEDHYVRIHRAGGSSLELMTMSDAMARYGAGKGLRAHRSWWVADAAVTGAERDGRNWRLRLSNGLSVPLARASVIEARAKGWIRE